MIVVDDERTPRDTICSCFPWSELGFAVTAQFDNGKDALDFISTNHVDVVFSDIIMPTMTGLEFAHKIYDSDRQIKIVFLSAHANFEYARKALMYGVKDYILKPAKYNELVDVFTRIRNELDQNREANAIKNVGNAVDSLTEHGNFNETVIAMVREYVQKNYKDANLEDVGNLVHMNPNYLSQFYKNHTGENFSDYLMKIRMEKSAELLKDISLKIYDVSDMVGYKNSKNFTRAFKRYYGKTPESFRYKG